MKIKMKILVNTFLIIVSILCLTTCSSHTDISYRANKSSEYIKQEGYVFSCNIDNNNFYVTFDTPDSWTEMFNRYDIRGINSFIKVKILKTKLKFLDTGDTLQLKEIKETKKTKDYIYSSSELSKIVDKNKRLQLTVYFQQKNDTTTLEKTFLLTRHEHTYSTGTFPHK